jgi:hypothetical protein
MILISMSQENKHFLVKVVSYRMTNLLSSSVKTTVAAIANTAVLKHVSSILPVKVMV